MTIPWFWVFFMTILEISFIVYKVGKGQDDSIDLAAGILVGIWMLILVSFLDAHVEVRVK